MTVALCKEWSQAMITESEEVRNHFHVEFKKKKKKGVQIPKFFSIGSRDVHISHSLLMFDPGHLKLYYLKKLINRNLI